jgi:stalled ribosome alternative rescue factor ArfA
MIKPVQRHCDEPSPMRPVRRLARIARECVRDVAVDGFSVNSLLRFRVEQVREGKTRWRDLHYSCWHHSS